MKKLLLLPAFILAACGSESATTAATEKPCAEISEKDMLMVGNQMRHYIAVPHFDTKSKECWQMLRAYKKSEDASPYLGSGANLLVFVDTVDFKAPKGGSFSESERKLIIAQELINKEVGIDEFTPDDQGMGIYKEPQ